MAGLIQVMTDTEINNRLANFLNPSISRTWVYFFYL